MAAACAVRGFTTARPMLTPNKVKVPGRKPQDEEDLTWAEADRKLTPEERYARDKQMALLDKMTSQVEELEKSHTEQKKSNKGVKAQIEAISRQLEALKAQLKE
uniref:inhibitor of F1 (IF1) n=1 Tax=Euglena gracilis TaxID=3039 RepID=UPI0012B67DB9|nr:Chain AN, inhibitor of F1 (IF1) [Euglena gracilis]6TDU_BN Chain BN, inhibitor of F1 (IF1) [Euglena gracilis]6TDY_N Chain N, inhibitor of F1 (IF1) [Euglena gracilis]6TDZ_N Chain N, inhibitor of F1 (IF1) [Euglena gracilis]|eukprot:EG_transcript_49190